MNLRLISLTGIFLVLFLNSKIFANEVGNKVAVASPKAKPIHVYTSKDGSLIKRSWLCNGFVNPKMIKIIYDELEVLSKASNLIPPNPNPALCLWRITDFQMGDLNHKLLEVQMFIDRSSMESCVLDDKCIDVRSMHFKGEGLREYMVTNSTRQIVSKACVSPNGSVISLNSGC